MASRGFKAAMDFIKCEKSWSDKDALAAIEKMRNDKCHLKDVNESIYQEINKLMEHFGEDNCLPYNWWRNEAEEDDIIIILYKMKRRR